MKKIMFNDKCGLTDAVLQGNKTMTRRICKAFRTNRIIYANKVESIGVYSDDNVVEFVLKDGGVTVSVPPYKIGEVVAVAQTYKDLGYSPTTIQRGRCIRKSTHGDNPGWSDGMIGQIGDWYIDQLAGWNNKMFVLPSMCNHQIRITDVKVERLQDISEEDCVREGIYKEENVRVIGYPFGIPFPYTFLRRSQRILHWTFAKEAFAVLIDKVSGKGTWNNNPYVFAYTFELVK